MNCFNKRLVIFILLGVSIQLQTGHKKFVYFPKKDTKEVKGILKSKCRDGFFRKNKKVEISDDIEQIPHYQTIGDQEWYKKSEAIRDQREVFFKKGRGDASLGRDFELQRVETLKLRRNFIVKGTKHDDLLQENINLKRFIFASAGVVTTTALYYFFTMKSSDEEF